MKRRTVCPTFTSHTYNLAVLYIERLIEDAYEEKTGEEIKYKINSHGKQFLEVDGKLIDFDEAFCMCWDRVMKMNAVRMNDDNCYETVYNELFGAGKHEK